MTCTAQPPQTLDAQINYTLGMLLETRGDDIYRMKGLLSIADSEYRFVYQVRSCCVWGGRETRGLTKMSCTVLWLCFSLLTPDATEANAEFRFVNQLRSLCVWGGEGKGPQAGGLCV